MHRGAHPLGAPLNRWEAILMANHNWRKRIKCPRCKRDMHIASMNRASRPQDDNAEFKCVDCDVTVRAPMRRMGGIDRFDKSRVVVLDSPELRNPDKEAP